MSAQQKYLYQYAYLDGSSFNAVENNNLYNDERGAAEILQNYNHNSLNLNFKAGEHTAKALSVLLANSEVGLILKAISHADIVSQYLDVYDLVKIGNINLSPNIHFYEVGGEFLSSQINNVDFLTRRVIPVNIGDIPMDDFVFTKINDGTNDYFVNAKVLTNGTTSFYYPTGSETGDPVALIDLRDFNAFSIKFNGDTIPDDFLSEFINTDCVMTIENAGSIMKIGNNVFANSEFSNIVANFTGIREIGSGVNLAKTGGTITTENPLGLVAYDDLTLQLTNDVKEIDGLIIASDFFASDSKKLLNDTCNALSHYKGVLTEIKNCNIVEDFADLTNLNMAEVVFDNCTFKVSQDFSSNPGTRTLTIRNCNQESTGAQVFTFTGFDGSIIIENSFKSATAEYVVDDTAAYALEIDNDSFINAGANSGSLNKVLTNENRDLPELLDGGAFLQINGNHIVSFSGTSFLTTGGTILTIPTISNIVFSVYQKWDLANGNFAFSNFFTIAATLLLYFNGTKESYLKGFVNKAFYKFTSGVDEITVYILASQLLDILTRDRCLTSSGLVIINVYNNLPNDFNYLEIARNDTSFIFDNATAAGMVMQNDPDDLLKNALQQAYPEYIYN